MLPTCVNRLSPQTISRVPAVCLPLLGGQNGGEGDNMRVRLRLVGCLSNPTRAFLRTVSGVVHSMHQLRPIFCQEEV
jgi:hypothetical protein